MFLKIKYQSPLLLTMTKQLQARFNINHIFAIKDNQSTLSNTDYPNETFGTAINNDDLMAATGGALGKLVGKGLKTAFTATRNALAVDAVIGMAGDAING